MSTTRYKIRLWEYDGEASVANAVTFDSFDEAQARFNDLRVSEEMPCVEFIKERIANGCIIGDEVLNVRQFTSVFDAITKDKPTLAGFLRFPSGHRSAVGRRISRTLLRRVRRGQLRRLPERAVPEQSGMVAFPSGGGGGTMTADRARGSACRPARRGREVYLRSALRLHSRADSQRTQAPADTGTTTAAGNASPSRRPYGCIVDRCRPSCGAYAVERERCGRTSRRTRPPEHLKRYTSRPPFFFLRAGRWRNMCRTRRRLKPLQS